jgi:hypothetical protein
MDFSYNGHFLSRTSDVYDTVAGQTLSLAVGKNLLGSSIAGNQ